MTPRPEHRRSLRDLPKAHLHLHLVGAMRPDTLESLGRKAGLAVDLATYFEGFDHFDETYMIANSAIRTADDLTRLILEVLEDAKADGAVWVEPTLYLDSFKDVIGPGELVLEIATDALKSARDQVGIGAALIVPAQRGMGPDDAVRQARLALRGDPDVVRAYGLVGIGRDRSIDGFGEALGIASSGGLALTPHAGEYSGGVSGAWGRSQVAWALDVGAARIQHGIAAAGDAALMERLADRRVCLDVCPTSNALLGAVESLEAHPLPTLLAQGIPISLSADDPLLFSCSLLSEYELARRAFALDDHELASIAEASIRHSTASDEHKASWLPGVGEWLASDG